MDNALWGAGLTKLSHTAECRRHTGNERVQTYQFSTDFDDTSSGVLFDVALRSYAN